MGLYTVRQVREFTGLTGKQLFSYEKSIPPVDRMDNDGWNGERYHKGYKLYDKEGLDKLTLAALFSELGAGPQKINAIFSQATYQRENALEDLLLEAKRKKQELEDVIIVAEALKEIDLSSMVYNPFQTNDLHGMAELIRKFNDSDDVIKFQEMDAQSEKKILQIFKKFKAVKAGDEDCEKAYELVEELISFMKEEIKINNYAIILTLISNGMIQGKKSKEIIEREIGDGMGERISLSIAKYQYTHMYEEGQDVIHKLYEMIGLPFSDKRVQQCVHSIVPLIEKWFGYTSIVDMIAVLKGAKLYSLYEEDAETNNYFSYMLDAFEYYKKNSIN